VLLLALLLLASALATLLASSFSLRLDVVVLAVILAAASLFAATAFLVVVVVTGDAAQHDGKPALRGLDRHVASWNRRAAVRQLEDLPRARRPVAGPMVKEHSEAAVLAHLAAIA